MHGIIFLLRPQAGPEILGVGSFLCPIDHQDLDKVEELAGGRMMGVRALALAERFEQINGEVMAFVDRCSEADWRTTCAAEGHSVGVVVHHVATAYLPEINCIHAFVTGQPLPPEYWNWELLDRANAQHAAQHASCTKEETQQQLRRNGALVAGFIRGLSDAQLDHTAHFALVGETRTTQRMVERILLGHPEEHLASIRSVR